MRIRKVRSFRAFTLIELLTTIVLGGGLLVLLVGIVVVAIHFITKPW